MEIVSEDCRFACGLAIVDWKGEWPIDDRPSSFQSAFDNPSIGQRRWRRYRCGAEGVAPPLPNAECRVPIDGLTIGEWRSSVKIVDLRVDWRLSIGGANGQSTIGRRRSNRHSTIRRSTIGTRQSVDRPSAFG